MHRGAVRRAPPRCTWTARSLTLRRCRMGGGLELTHRSAWFDDECRRKRARKPRRSGWSGVAESYVRKCQVTSHMEQLYLGENLRRCSPQSRRARVGARRATVLHRQLTRGGGNTTRGWPVQHQPARALTFLASRLYSFTNSCRPSVSSVSERAPRSPLDDVHVALLRWPSRRPTACGTAVEEPEPKRLRVERDTRAGGGGAPYCEGGGGG